MEARNLGPPLFTLILSACTTTHVTSVETDMFDNDPEQILKVYNLVEEKSLGLENGQVITKNDLETMGFNFKAPNVEEFAGPVALRKIFGPKSFLSVYKKDNRPSNSLKQLEVYRGFFLPYKRIVTTVDRIYFSTQENFRKGEQIDIFLLFNGENLCYHEIKYLKIDTYYARTAPLELLFVLFKAPGKAASDVLDTLQTYQRPGIDDFTRVR